MKYKAQMPSRSKNKTITIIVVISIIAIFTLSSCDYTRKETDQAHHASQLKVIHSSGHHHQQRRINRSFKLNSKDSYKFVLICQGREIQYLSDSWSKYTIPIPNTTVVLKMELLSW